MFIISRYENEATNTHKGGAQNCQINSDIFMFFTLDKYKKYISRLI